MGMILFPIVFVVFWGLSVGLLGATAFLGGARNFGLVPLGVHSALAWATIALNLVALPVDWHLLRKSGAVVLALEAELETIVADMEEKGEIEGEGPMPWQV